MTFRMTTRVLLGILALAATSIATQAQRPNRPILPGEDWVQLFNGTCRNSSPTQKPGPAS